MSSIKTLIAIVIASSAVLSFTVQAKTTPKPANKAHAVAAASKGATAKKPGKARHVSKPAAKKSQKAKPSAKQSPRASDKPAGNYKGPGLEAY